MRIFINNNKNLHIMQRIWIYLFLLLSLSSNAQNLVSNYSFEDTVHCPVALTSIFQSQGWTSYKNTPDYFNSCNANGQAGVPNNAMGYQLAKTGNAYAGFTTYAKFANNFREVIGTHLLQPLQVGQKYFLSFYLNNPMDSVTRQNGATTKTGARFSTVSFAQSNPLAIDNFAHIYTDSLITDSLNWIKISGSFIADSAYEYMAFGNFFVDTACAHILYDSSAAFAYYYIDDIRLSIDSNFVNGTTNALNEGQIKIYPNPAHEALYVEGNKIRSIEVTDMFGRVVVPEFFSSLFKTRISLLQFSHGVYFIKVNLFNKILTKKIVHN